MRNHGPFIVSAAGFRRMELSSEFEKVIKEWRNSGFSAVHHSNEFHKNYNFADAIEIYCSK